MAARLLYRDAQGRSGEVALVRDEPTYIGRALECAVRTDDAMVSRKHTLIRREGEGFVVEDLGSSNGTHVNDVRVERLALKHNDVVRCGNLWLRYIEDLDEAAPRSTDPGPGPGGPRPSPVPSIPAVDPGPAPAAPAAAADASPRERRGSTPAPTMAQGSDSSPPVASTGNSPDSVVGTVVSTGMPGTPPRRQARPTPTGMGVARPTPADAEERLRRVHQRAVELERSLFMLQRELIGVQQHLTDLLESVIDLKDLADGS